MEERTAPNDPERLLAERPWVRRIARALVRDGARAEDLEQSVWLRALERPREVRSPRAWLGTALRNAAADLFRRDGRRRRREEAAARPEAAPAADEALARAEEIRRAVDAALGLPEPYRSTVVLRFFEGLPPREIARRLGLPRETVRTRLRRALDLLRGRLDAGHGGDRRSWFALLLPLARPGPLPAPPGVPAAPAEAGAWSGADAAWRAADASFREGAAMTLKTGLAAGLGAAFAALAGLWLLRGMVPPAGPGGAPPSGPPARPGGPPREATVLPGVDPTASGEGAAKGPDPGGLPYVGSGRRAEGVTGPVPEAHAAPPEEVEEHRRAVAAAEDARLQVALGFEGRRKADEAPEGAPCIEGRVVDEAGNPVTGGSIRILPSGGVVEGGPGMTLFGVHAGKSEFRSPALAPGVLYDVSGVNFRGFLGGKVAGVAPDGKQVTIVLRRGGRIEGRVLEQDGTPVRGRVGVSAQADPEHRKGGDLGFFSQAGVKPDGSFVLEGLADVPFRLSAGGEDYRCPADLPLVRPGERAEIRVSRGVALLGTIRGWTAEDSRRFVLFGRQDGEPGRLGQVAPDGTFTLRALAEGPVRLEIYPASDPARRTDLGTFTAPGSGVEAVLPEGPRAEGTPK